ncbi:MAG: hypothetical protein ACTHJW_17900 [Streptosporangiaceae bacterium]
MAKRAHFAHVAFHQAEAEARDWLTSRLHPAQPAIPGVDEKAEPEPAAPALGPAPGMLTEVAGTRPS